MNAGAIARITRECLSLIACVAGVTTACNEGPAPDVPAPPNVPFDAPRPSGLRSALTDVAEFGDGKRAGGMPKLRGSESRAFVAWTDAVGNRFRMAEVKMQSLGVLKLTGPA
ncbi:MAG: hypothetical protein M3Y64_05560 [Gemmatimonadota bacterium]|nr:hypothetical protein [Gemmatimonadota bacterium]